MNESEKEFKALIEYYSLNCSKCSFYNRNAKKPGLVDFVCNNENNKYTSLLIPPNNNFVCNEFNYFEDRE